MSGNTIKMLANLEHVQSTVVHDSNFSQFPENAKEGTQVTVGGIPYILSAVAGGDPQWMPMGAKNNAFVMTMETPQNVWTVNHKLGSEDINVVTYDINKSVIFGHIKVISPDDVEVTFNSPQSGKIVVLSAQDTFTGVKDPSITESTIAVGSGEPSAGETSTLYIELDA